MTTVTGCQEGCGHDRCRRLIRSAFSAIGASFAIMLADALLGPVSGTALDALVAVAGLLAVAGLVLACWPHPAMPAAELEALIDVTRETRTDRGLAPVADLSAWRSRRCQEDTRCS